MVVLTGADDEALSIAALASGAQDFLVKGQFDIGGLPRFLRYAIERRWLEDALYTSDARAQS